DYQIVDKDRNVQYSETDTIKPLAPGQSTIISKEFVSDSLIDENRLIVKTNPDFKVPELYSFNNNFEKAFYVECDKERPLLEVAIDGHRILDGDIVSPKPTIVISGDDNNEFFKLNDPKYFEVYLEKIDSGIKKIDQNQPGFTFYPAINQNTKAKIEYKPNLLSDGNYILKVQLKDASGNTSGIAAYKVQFEVVGNSTITNFFPYPNPFSTEMRFVFTLTGEKEPDDIIIQILTVSGKVVREITKNELGPIKIGHNTSTFAWNGTDTYGNKLANGVYLYRVKTVIDGKQVELRNTQADQGFKEQFGKIYILR
ncbi:MAG: FlgD immunoglobulin-like domain containing protein, partial [Bacteroidia bacterium]